MRYAKILTAVGPLYVIVDQQDGILWATGPMLAPEEDLAARAYLTPAFQPVPLAELTLLPPVTPSKIVCVGRNYKDHATELGNEVPVEPLLFLKPPSSLLASGAIVVMPVLSKRVDYEGELAVVIGKRCRNVGRDEDVRPYLRGFTCLNDVTARDIQKSDNQWTRGKGFDTFCPVGPVVTLLTDGEFDLCGGPGAPAQTATVTTRLNGELRQSASTADLIFPIPHLLRYISACMTLEPGDVIATGTPAGVGAVQPGDSVEIQINGIGILENRFANE